jgi:tetratricopeptide (TPR) repeat protein
MTDKTLSAADLPKLVVQLPDGKEVHHPIAGGEITIGRDPSNRIVVADQFVSKFHAKLLFSQSSITLVDLGSANKTYLNGAPIREAAVKYGDELQFAGVRSRLHAPESEKKAARPAPPPPVAKASPVPPPARPAAAAPVAAPAVKAKPAPAPGRSAPPRIEADPMKRLLRIGGLLIAVSLALAVLLRVLLVPSGDAPPAEEKRSGQSAPPAPSPTSSPAATPDTTASTAPPTSRPPSAGTAASTSEEYFEQGLSFLDTGRLREARNAFQKVLEIDPDNTRAKTRLSLLEEEISKKADQHFGNGRQAFQYLRYEEAVGEWEIFLTLADPSDPRYAEAEQGIQQAKAKLR